MRRPTALIAVLAVAALALAGLTAIASSASSKPASPSTRRDCGVVWKPQAFSACRACHWVSANGAESSPQA